MNILAASLFLALFSTLDSTFSLSPRFYHSNKQPLAWPTSWTPREPSCLPTSCTVRAMRGSDRGIPGDKSNTFDDEADVQERGEKASRKRLYSLYIRPRFAPCCSISILLIHSLTPSSMLPLPKNTGGPGGAAYLMPAGAFLISFYFSFLSLDDASAKRKEKTLLRRLAASVCSFSSFRSPGRVGRGL